MPNNARCNLAVEVGAVLFATCDYGPFGELIRATGPMAKLNPFTFGTYFYDWETDKYYAKNRYYDPSPSKWLSRDPAGENQGGPNLYGFVGNDGINRNDPFGLWSTDVHHQIVEDWLGPKYRSYSCGCCTIDVISQIEDGSDDVDGVGWWGLPWTGWWEAQSSQFAFRHAMRAPNQSVADAQTCYNSFVQANLNDAKAFTQMGGCDNIKAALFWLGKAFHSVSDSYSPAHMGFQIWWDPINGPAHFGDFFSYYFGFVKIHESQENMAAYNRIGGQVPKKKVIRVTS